MYRRCLFAAVIQIGLPLLYMLAAIVGILPHPADNVPMSEPPPPLPPDPAPPAARPPEPAVPVAEPPVAEPPDAEPPVAEPPVAEPPVAEPPDAEPPLATAPVPPEPLGALPPEPGVSAESEEQPIEANANELRMTTRHARFIGLSIRNMVYIHLSEVVVPSHGLEIYSFAVRCWRW